MKILYYLMVVIEFVRCFEDETFADIQCKSNTLLNLSSFSINNLNDTLYLKPTFGVNKFCQNLGNYSCCTSDSFTIFNSLISNEIAMKKEIHDKNLIYFSLIINEHLRNFNSFNISQSDSANYFSVYSNFTKYLEKLATNIVSSSIKWQWSSFCNYICSPNFNKLCIYDNSSVFSCNMDLDLISEILYNTITFNNEMQNIENTLTYIYQDIINRTSNLGFNNTNVSIVVNVNGSSQDFSYKELLVNSLNDGKYVSINFSINPFACESIEMCKDILDKFCVPFYCFDDNFLQFNQNYLNTTDSLTKGSFQNFTYNANYHQSYNNSKISSNSSNFSTYYNYTDYNILFAEKYQNISNSDLISFKLLGIEIENLLSPLNFSFASFKRINHLIPFLLLFFI